MLESPAIKLVINSHGEKYPKPVLHNSSLNDNNNNNNHNPITYGMIFE